VACLLLLPYCSGAAGDAAPPGAAESGLTIAASEFIFDTAPFRSCHASTIVQTPAGLAAAWFGGTDEGNSDVSIWLSRHDGKRWSAPVEVANGAETTTTRQPCWNPVLFQAKGGPLLLFYKVGPSPKTWHGMLITSTDDGKTWSKPQTPPKGILGPIKNKPVQLPSGDLLCGSSTEANGWQIHIERTSDLGKTWSKTAPLNDGKETGLIQPTILSHGNGRVQLLCRSRQGKVYQAWSEDEGKTWSRPSPTELPNPNSGIDAVQLKDGRSLLVYNHTPKDRSPLNIALSVDGKSWTPALVLENEAGEYSYPAVMQAADGRIHITYTWKRRRIKHVVVEPKVEAR
jgi:predicted neuraminidase